MRAQKASDENEVQIASMAQPMAVMATIRYKGPPFEGAYGPHGLAPHVRPNSHL